MNDLLGWDVFNKKRLRYSYVHECGSVMTKYDMCIGNVYALDFILEEWRDINKYEGIYQVSNMGRVRSTKTQSVRKLSKNNTGYLIVPLSKDGVKTLKRVNRLVADTFIPNPDNLPQVNHKDEIKTNNYIGNLEWCTQKYNLNYGSRNERISESKKGIPNKTNRKGVLQYNLDGTLVREWGTMKEAAESGFKIANIHKCCNGLRNKHGGFKWQYKE